MTTPTGVRTWLNQRRLDAALRGILLNPASGTTQTPAQGAGRCRDPCHAARHRPMVPRPPGRADHRLPLPRLRDEVPPKTNVTASLQLRWTRTKKETARLACSTRAPPKCSVGRTSASCRCSADSKGQSTGALRIRRGGPRKYYVAAATNGQTFLAIKRRGHGLVVGLTLPHETTHPRLADDAGEFNWSRITKVARVGTDSDVDEELLFLIAQAATHAPQDVTRTSKFYGVSLRDLLDAGLLEPGERLILATGGREAATVRVTASGELSWQDRTYRSPSDRAFAALLGRQSLNGWTAWYVERPQGRRSLADLRTTLQATLPRSGT